RGHTLDEVMQLVWQRYGKTEIPYHVRDLQLALGEVVGDQAWAKSWFAKHIYGSELPDIGALLDNYGFVLAPTEPDSVGFFRLRLQEKDSTLTVRGAIAENNPLYQAGLDQGCKITELNGVAITSRDDWDAGVRNLTIGQTYSISFTQLGRKKTGQFVAAASPELAVSYTEGKVKKKMMKQREAWLWKK
ncbi:MAG: M61 family peptidase, partial [Lewinella sp.]